MPNSIQAMQLLVAPVVMISACGLLCLALYARLAMIVARTRAFNRERIDLLAEPDANDDRVRHRLQILEKQVHHIIRRARLIRSSLVLLLCTVLCMLVCSLALGASLFGSAWFTVAMAIFIAGVLCCMAGIATAIFELFHALRAVTLESTEIEPPDANCGQA